MTFAHSFNRQLWKVLRVSGRVQDAWAGLGWVEVGLADGETGIYKVEIIWEAEKQTGEIPAWDSVSMGSETIISCYSTGL